MPILHWIGKDKVLNHHLIVPTKTLKASSNLSKGGGLECALPLDKQGDNYSPPLEGVNICSPPLEGLGEASCIIQGDNLLALKALLPMYQNRINCIYIDPPYNTGNETWMYNDNINNYQTKQWLQDILGGEFANANKHDQWLCMMYPRLKLLHQLLADDGVIFVSIDDNEQANLKLIMNEIFGEDNFIATFYWKRTATPPSLSATVRKKLEPLFCYQKTNIPKHFNGGSTTGGDMPLLNATNPVSTIKFSKDNVTFKLKDGHYKATTYNNISLLNGIDIVAGKAQQDIVLSGRFKWSQSTVNYETQNNTQFIIKTSKFSVRYQRQGDRRKIPSNIISYNECMVGTNEDAAKELTQLFGEKTFSFPKPVSLIEYLIGFVDNPNAIVLDCFAGSGTTAHAVLNLNKQDGGNRQFILIELEDYAKTLTAERIKRVIKGYDKIEGTGGSFRFYELA